MSFANPGVSGLILIVIVLILVFGPSKLPEIGKAFGKSLREFKDATKGIMEESNTGKNDASAAQQNVHTTTRTVEPIEIKTDDTASK